MPLAIRLKPQGRDVRHIWVTFHIACVYRSVYVSYGAYKHGFLGLLRNLRKVPGSVCINVPNRRVYTGPLRESAADIPKFRKLKRGEDGDTSLSRQRLRIPSWKHASFQAPFSPFPPSPYRSGCTRGQLVVVATSVCRPMLGPR